MSQPSTYWKTDVNRLHKRWANLGHIAAGELYVEKFSTGSGNAITGKNWRLRGLVMDVARGLQYFSFDLEDNDSKVPQKIDIKRTIPAADIANIIEKPGTDIDGSQDTTSKFQAAIEFRVKGDDLNSNRHLLVRVGTEEEYKLVVSHAYGLMYGAQPARRRKDIQLGQGLYRENSQFAAWLDQHNAIDAFPCLVFGAEIEDEKGNKRHCKALSPNELCGYSEREVSQLLGAVGASESLQKSVQQAANHERAVHAFVLQRRKGGQDGSTLLYVTFALETKKDGKWFEFELIQEANGTSAVTKADLPSPDPSKPRIGPDPGLLAPPGPIDGAALGRANQDFNAICQFATTTKGFGNPAVMVVEFGKFCGLESALPSLLAVQDGHTVFQRLAALLPTPKHIVTLQATESLQRQKLEYDAFVGGIETIEGTFREDIVVEEYCSRGKKFPFDVCPSMAGLSVREIESRLALARSQYCSPGARKKLLSRTNKSGSSSPLSPHSPIASNSRSSSPFLPSGNAELQITSALTLPSHRCTTLNAFGVKQALEKTSVQPTNSPLKYQDPEATTARLRGKIAIASAALRHQ